MNPNIFREYDIRGIVGVHLTDDTVAVLGRAIGTFLFQNGAKRIAIGSILTLSLGKSWTLIPLKNQGVFDET